MNLKGNVYRMESNINTDVIMPGRWCFLTDDTELAKHCMEDLDDKFLEKINPGDILVAGKNFGCGSSREHAPLAIRTAEISCVLAKSFARIFYRNAIATGELYPIECTERLIDTIKSVNAWPHMRIMVSGGLFNRAEGLWQEMDADLYAATALEALQVASNDNLLAQCERRTINRRKKRRQITPQEVSVVVHESV